MRLVITQAHLPTKLAKSISFLFLDSYAFLILKQVLFLWCAESNTQMLMKKSADNDETGAILQGESKRFSRRVRPN